MTDSLLEPNLNNSDPVEQLIGPGGKFYDPDRNVAIAKMAKGKIESDIMINSQNKRFDAITADYLALRNEHNAGAKLQELIDRLEEQKNSNNSNNTPAVDEPVKQSVFDPSLLDTYVSDKVNALKQQDIQQSNFNAVQESLQQRFGDNYHQTVGEQTKKLGLTSEEVNSLARRSPQAFYRMMGMDGAKQEPFQAPPRSEQRSDQFAPRTEKRTWSYWKNQMKTDPNWTNSKSHIQMMDDIKAIGEKAFYDVD